MLAPLRFCSGRRFSSLVLTDGFVDVAKGVTVAAIFLRVCLAVSSSLLHHVARCIRFAAPAANTCSVTRLGAYAVLLPDDRIDRHSTPSLSASYRLVDREFLLTLKSVRQDRSYAQITIRFVLSLLYLSHPSTHPTCEDLISSQSSSGRLGTATAGSTDMSPPP